MLKITDLVKRYGSGDPVLKNLDLTIEGESVVSIIGSSGAGKSTLLRCINRLVEPTSGTIELNGTDLTGTSGLRRIPVNNSLRTQLRGMVAQLNLSHPDSDKRYAAVQRFIRDGVDAETAALLTQHQPNEESGRVNDAIDAVMIADRKKDRDWIKSRSIQNNIDKVRAPVLMAYGMKDWRAPPKHGCILKRALDRNNIPNKLIIKANEGHGYRNEDNIFEFYREVDAFLEQHMK